MNLWKISLQNIKMKPLYTFLSVAILGLSIALLLGIQQLKVSFQYQMENNLGDIDLVIGAKGSPLQLVLSSVLHLDNPTGNISYKEAKKIARHPMTEKAIPVSYGDNYKGYRIVGTSEEFSSIYEAQIYEGREVETSMEVVLGSYVAKVLQLKIGDTFMSSHGLLEGETHVHEKEFTVVGIYQPTKKVIDRLIVTNLESIWDVHDDHDHDHDHEHGASCSHGSHDDENQEITSMLISYKNPMALLTMPRHINENTSMQAALPKFELDKLYKYTGVGFQTISWVAYIILVISCMIIFTSIYKMVKERAFDLALLRTYGATNFQLVLIMLFEGLFVALFAFTIGCTVAQLGLNFIMNSLMAKEGQLVLQNLKFMDYAQNGMMVLLMVVISVVLAIYPILKMNISTIISNEK